MLKKNTMYIPSPTTCQHTGQYSRREPSCKPQGWGRCTAPQSHFGDEEGQDGRRRTLTCLGFATNEREGPVQGEAREKTRLGESRPRVRPLYSQVPSSQSAEHDLVQCAFVVARFTAEIYAWCDLSFISPAAKKKDASNRLRHRQRAGAREGRPMS